MTVLDDHSYTGYNPHTFCGYCGHRFNMLDWPRTCHNCKQITYRNPTPVSVLLVPVWATDDPKETRRGILVGKRGHNPGLGLWGLPGGFLELSENFETGAWREFSEEIGVGLNKDYVSIIESRPTTHGTQVLVFNEYLNTLPPNMLKAFRPNVECTEIKVCFAPEDLAFQTHTEALRSWLEREWR